jgi:hypothetical protein
MATTETGRTLLAIALVVAHAVVSVVLLFAFIATAYAISREGHNPMQWAYSPGEVAAEMGPAPRFVYYGLALLGLLSFIGTIIAVAVPRFRRRAWLVPAAGILASVLLVAIAVLAL